MRNDSAPRLLLPVKSISLGKQRLKQALSDRERTQLNEFFLVRMLGVARRCPGLDKTAVVSDADDTATLAKSCGARTIRCDTSGLNQAVACGRYVLMRERAAPLLVLPVDLPFVEPEVIQELSDLGRNHAAIICPDRTGPAPTRSLRRAE